MRGKSREILRLFSEGMHQAEIARQLNCTSANVSLTIKRHAEWDLTVRGLPVEHQQWLIHRGKNLRVKPSDMAARLLMEIIDIYRTGDA